ncbi:hypothetical protein IAU60_006085 [Kwoniella sp. DSM 27419]
MQVDIDLQPPAETSKAGLRRMRRLYAQAPVLDSTPKVAIHPTTSHLIYQWPNPEVPGLVHASLFVPAHPLPLATPAVLTPGKQLSVSTDGDWTVIFHPNPSDEGGTLAIYTSIIMSPVSTPSNIVPLATFPLVSKPLATTHLYPPRTHLPHSRAAPLGPAPPTNLNSTRGPTFLVLLASSLILFHPQEIPTTVAIDARVPTAPTTAWTMSFLQCPLHTRWHATIGGNLPPEDGWTIRKGWMGLIPGDRHVWVGWEREDEVGVTAAAVGVNGNGTYHLQTIPMPSLLHSVVPPLAADASTKEVYSDLQGIIFTALKRDLAKDPHDGNASVDSSLPSDIVTAGAVLVYQDTAVYSTHTRARLEMHAFERREVELAEGFKEIGSGGGEVVASWDWATVPVPRTSVCAPISTTIIALGPIPALEPQSLALALISEPEGVSLIHIDLASPDWRVVGDPVELGEIPGGTDMDIVVSPSATRGQLGLAAVVGGESGSVLAVVPRFEGQSTLGSTADSDDLLISDTATAIVLAERQGVDWSDVARAACSSVGVGYQKGFISGVARRIASLAEGEAQVDDLDLLLRVQIALYSATHDARLDLAADTLRLKSACTLVERCAIFEQDGKISFDLDCVWPLIGVFEWTTEVIAQAMREVLVLNAKMEWSPDDSSAAFGHPSSIILLAHPTLRAIVIKLLSQLSQFTLFLSSLEKPILQLETRSLPAPIKRDPMATIVARERIRDVAYSQGFDVMEWGKGLEQVHIAGLTEEDSHLALLDLSLAPLQAHLATLASTLPSSSTLFMSSAQSGLSPDAAHDGITYQPLTSTHGVTAGVQPASRARCGRCGWTTEALALPGAQTGSIDSPWMEWKRSWQNRCMCGGSWTRIPRSRQEEPRA